jgi:hypothetical protein
VRGKLAVLWENVQPHLTPRLQDAVARTCAVFGKYRLSGSIVHCGCPACMSAEMAVKLASLPLDEIDASLLAEYTNSAHGYDRQSIEPEFKHFLPRYCALIANCDPPSHLGLETCLCRLLGYRDRWPAAEVEAVDAFFDAFVAASVHQLGLVEWPVGLRLEFDMGEVLGMVVQAGGDLERVLAEFDACPDPPAAVHMASMRHDVRVRKGGPYFGNAHYGDFPEAAGRIGEWLMRGEVTERIVAAQEALANPAYDDLLNLGMR